MILINSKELKFVIDDFFGRDLISIYSYFIGKLLLQERKREREKNGDMNLSSTGNYLS